MLTGKYFYFILIRMYTQYIFTKYNLTYINNDNDYLCYMYNTIPALHH